MSDSEIAELRRLLRLQRVEIGEQDKIIAQLRLDLNNSNSLVNALIEDARLKDGRITKLEDFIGRLKNG